MRLRDLVYRDIPQSEAITRMRDLPALPEAARMTTKPPARRKPRTVREWRQQHDRRSA